MTQLKGFKLAVDESNKKQDEKKNDSKSKHKARETSINVVQPMFVLQSQNEQHNESSIQSKEEKLLAALKEQNRKSKQRLCLVIWLVVVPLMVAIISFTGLIYMRLEEQGRTITEIFSEN